jgi:putative acetyltransferase
MNRSSFRESFMIETRLEAPADHAAIRDVLRTAFPDDCEARLVDLLRERQKVLISLVAATDGRVVGNIVFSPIAIEKAPAGFRGVGLAPVAVLPEHQNRGIGSQLIREGLTQCKQHGYDAVVVLGHPNYYPRFGFQIASAHGLTNEYGADEAFMVLELRDGVLGKIRGVVRYTPEFREVDC